MTPDYIRQKPQINKICGTIFIEALSISGVKFQIICSSNRIQSLSRTTDISFFLTRLKNHFQLPFIFKETQPPSALPTGSVSNVIDDK